MGDGSHGEIEVNTRECGLEGKVKKAGTVSQKVSVLIENGYLYCDEKKYHRLVRMKTGSASTELLPDKGIVVIFVHRETKHMFGLDLLNDEELNMVHDVLTDLPRYVPGMAAPAVVSETPPSVRPTPSVECSSARPACRSTGLMLPNAVEDLPKGKTSRGNTPKKGKKGSRGDGEKHQHHSLRMVGDDETDTRALRGCDARSFLDQDDYYHPDPRDDEELDPYFSAYEGDFCGEEDDEGPPLDPGWDWGLDFYGDSDDEFGRYNPYEKPWGAD